MVVVLRKLRMELLRDSNDQLIADISLVSDLLAVLSPPSCLETFVYSFVQIHGPRWDTLSCMLGPQYTVTHLQIIYAHVLERVHGRMAHIRVGPSK